MSYLEIRNINKYFVNNQVLSNIEISIQEGKLVSFLGPSGCGKSTLLRCIAGLEKVTDGAIWLDGKDITHIPIQQRNVGMVFQHYSLFPNLTVAGNVSFGLSISRVNKKTIEKEVEEILEIVGLANKKDRFPAFLSGGEQQRVALARALIMKPKVLLLDEPLSALDALLRRNLQIEIRRIQQQLGITTLFVTHDQSEAMTISDMIYLFNIGKIEQYGTPIDLYTNPQTEFAASFIGNYNLLTAFEFAQLTNAKVDSPYIAFRPEMIRLTKDEHRDDLYDFIANVKEISIHGNFIRYVLSYRNITFSMDVLCGSENPFEIGTSYNFMIAKENVLAISKNEAIYGFNSNRKT